MIIYSYASQEAPLLLICTLKHICKNLWFLHYLSLHWDLIQKDSYSSNLEYLTCIMKGWWAGQPSRKPKFIWKSRSLAQPNPKVRLAKPIDWIYKLTWLEPSINLWNQIFFFAKRIHFCKKSRIKVKSLQILEWLAFSHNLERTEL